jgi:hypothetical protein
MAGDRDSVEQRIIRTERDGGISVYMSLAERVTEGHGRWTSSRKGTADRILGRKQRAGADSG